MTGSRTKGNLEKPLLPLAALFFCFGTLWLGAVEGEEGPTPAPQEPGQIPEQDLPQPPEALLLPRTDWSISFEPALMNPKNALPLAGSRDVVIVPAELRDWIWQEMAEDRFAHLNTPLETYLPQAVRNSLPLLEEVQPQFYRNAKEVIEYGLLRSEDDPRLPTVILLPEFYQRFEPIFGPNFLVILPNRLSVYLFPRLAGNLDEHAAMLLSIYETSQYPATSLSKDIFVVTEDGIVLGGRLLDPRTDPVEWFTGNGSESDGGNAEPTPQAALDLEDTGGDPEAGSSAQEPLSVEPRDEQLPELRPGSYE